MIANTVVRRLLRENRLFEMLPNMEMARSEGMQTMDQAMADLVKKGIVTSEEALARSGNPAKLTILLQNQHKGGGEVTRSGPLTSP
jgi:twitching motility protein PilT